MAAAEPLLEVGRIGRAHGVRGDLYVDLLTDRDERLDRGAQVQANGVWLTVATARRAGDRWRVHFEGVDDRAVAERLVGVPLLAEPLPPGDDDGWYVNQLIGCAVVGRDGTAHGRCVAVVANPANDLLELESGALVPIVFVTSVDGSTVVIDPPDGLFDLR